MAEIKHGGRQNDRVFRHGDDDIWDVELLTGMRVPKRNAGGIWDRDHAHWRAEGNQGQ
jgi:hypothetical protein